MNTFTIPSSIITIYYIIKWLFIIFDIVLVCGVVYAVIQAWKFHPDFEKGGHGHHGGGEHDKHVPTMREVVLKERWLAIEKKFALGTSESARLAIIEADALVDSALKGMMIPGEHLADRLSNLEMDDIKSMNRVWRAHRLRNDLVHTPGFGVSPTDAKRTIEDFQAFLKEIEAID